MKKRFRVVVCLLSVCLCLLFVMQVEAAEQGCSIIISASATEQETYAANTLQKYLEMVTGKPVPVYFDGRSGEGFEFSVGNTNRYSEDFSQKTDGSWKMKSYDGGLAIVGTPNKGAIYGVYGFLEQYCGFRYYTAEHIKINDSLDFSALQNVDYAYNAFFEYTETDWLYSRDAEYSLANGLNGGGYRTLEERQGGTIPYIPTFVHSLSNYFCSRDVYFESNPECFALRDGKRVSSQLCLTHPKTYEIVLADVFRYLEHYHNPQASLQIITLSQDDNEMYCQCSSCAAFDQKTGSPAGTMLDFVNRIAREVKRAGYHNVAIDTLAYKYTRKAPVGIFPEDNVIVRLCSIECCFSHPLSDPSCKENANFMQDLRDWSQICQRLYVWDYATNYFTTIGLFPNFGVLQSNMQTFYQHNVKGVYVEGNYYMAQCDTEFGALREYLISRLMKDPYCDYDSEMKGFLEAFYGEGGDEIYQFIQIITEGASKRHLSIYQKQRQTMKLSNKQVKLCDSLWANAKAQTSDPKALANIVRSELSWRVWKSANRKSEFKSLIFGGLDARAKLYDDLLSHDVLIASESILDFEESRLIHLREVDIKVRNTDTWGYCAKNRSDFVDFFLTIYLDVVQWLAELFA